MSRGHEAETAGAHVTPDEVALFVLDALSPVARQRFEGHVAGCGPCGQALAAEAAAEEALVALWPAVRRPLAEVVPLSRAGAVRSRVPAAAAVPVPARRPPAGMVAQSSFGGLAAAVVAVLFLGWWTDAGRNITGIGPGGSAVGLTPLTAGLSGSALASGETGEGPVCAVGDSGPQLAAMASWGMCTGGAPAFGAALCRPAPLPVCRMPPTP
jgi:hypothetical protein